MPRHCNVDNLSVREPDDEEDVKRLEQDRRDAEKVASPHVRCMSSQELPPCAGWAPGATPAHIFGDGPGGNLKPQPRQFGLNALLTPKVILGSHACDQSSKLYRDCRAAASCFMRGSPPPVCPPTRSLPAQNCFRLHNQQRMTPIAEPSACQDPKAPIGVVQARPRMLPLPAQSAAAADKGFPRLAAPLASKLPQWLRPATVTPNAPAAIIPGRAPRRRLVNAINPPDRPWTGICALQV
jgi:hypothetical protein